MEVTEVKLWETCVEFLIEKLGREPKEHEILSLFRDVKKKLGVVANRVQSETDATKAVAKITHDEVCQIQVLEDGEWYNIEVSTSDLISLSVDDLFFAVVG